MASLAERLAVPDEPFLYPNCMAQIPGGRPRGRFLRHDNLLSQLVVRSEKIFRQFGERVLGGSATALPLRQIGGTSFQQFWNNRG